MNVKAFYDAIGGNYNEAMTRLMNDTLAAKFIHKFLGDPSFQSLKEAVEKKNWDDAFTASHTLKGVALNMSFQQLGNMSIALTDALRPQYIEKRNDEKLCELYHRVEEAYNKVVETIHKYEAM